MIGSTVGKQTTPVFYCFEQQPKPKAVGPCVVSVEHNGMALLLDSEGKNVIRRMDRSRIDWMHKDGFMVSGFEETGNFKNGVEIYHRQEWFCRYPSLQANADVSH